MVGLRNVGIVPLRDMATGAIGTYTEKLKANFSMISSGMTVVCGLPNPFSPYHLYGEDLMEMRANANLIKAAPAMYEALKEVHEALMGWQYELRGSEPYERRIRQAFNHFLVPALAKAEGKE